MLFARFGSPVRSKTPHPNVHYTRPSPHYTRRPHHTRSHFGSRPKQLSFPRPPNPALLVTVPVGAHAPCSGLMTPRRARFHGMPSQVCVMRRARIIGCRDVLGSTDTESGQWYPHSSGRIRGCASHMALLHILRPSCCLPTWIVHLILGPTRLFKRRSCSVAVGLAHMSGGRPVLTYTRWWRGSRRTMPNSAVVSADRPTLPQRRPPELPHTTSALHNTSNHYHHTRRHCQSPLCAATSRGNLLARQVWWIPLLLHAGLGPWQVRHVRHVPITPTRYSRPTPHNTPATRTPPHHSHFVSSEGLLLFFCSLVASFSCASSCTMGGSKQCSCACLPPRSEHRSSSQRCS